MIKKCPTFVLHHLMIIPSDTGEPYNLGPQCVCVIICYHSLCPAALIVAYVLSVHCFCVCFFKIAEHVGLRTYIKFCIILGDTIDKSEAIEQIKRAMGVKMKLWVLHRLKSGIINSKMGESQLRVTNVLADFLPAEILKQLRHFKG